MDRILSDNVGYDAQGRRIFKDGPPATTLPAEWANSVQEEIMAVIEGEFQSPSITNLAQLYAGITHAINSAVTTFTDRYITVHELTAKSIISANSSNNLDQYISGGSLAKPTGWKVRHFAQSGTGSFGLTPSTVYTINGLSCSSWIIRGSGALTFELDNENSNWKIVEDLEYVFDEFTITSGAYTQTCHKKIKNDMEIKIKHSASFTCNDAIGALFFDNAVYISNVTFIHAFSAAPELTGLTGYNTSGSNHIHIVVSGGSSLSATDSMTCSPVRYQSSAALTIISIQTYRGTWR